MNNTWKTDEQFQAEFAKMAPWLRKTVFGQGFNGVMIGMSGGFDSTFCAFVASQKEALGPDGVVGVSMPCQSSPDSISDAIRACDILGIRLIAVDIANFFNPMVAYLDSIRQQAGIAPMGALERGNIKARLRMTTLYSLNWVHECLVMNTCNLSETMTGNETKYGDAAGDLGLLNTYTKTELFQMSQAVGFEKLFPNIHYKVPTPDLENGNPMHTDENIMGISYLQLDRSILGIETSCLRDEEVKIVNDLMSRSAHKRNPMKIFDPNEEEL